MAGRHRRQRRSSRVNSWRTAETHHRLMAQSVPDPHQADRRAGRVARAAMGAHGTVVRYAGNAPGVSNLWWPIAQRLGHRYHRIVLSGQESPGPVASSCTAA
jgi:hypothetical protein